MSCECNSNLIKSLEKKYPRLRIYNLQYCCVKCGCISQSIKNTDKGIGFIKWSKNQIRRKDEGNKLANQVKGEE